MNREGMQQAVDAESLWAIETAARALKLMPLPMALIALTRLREWLATGGSEDPRELAKQLWQHYLTSARPGRER